MLRKKIQEKTGLTRKAIEYYQEKGLVKPKTDDKGYRDYSEEDLLKLEKISLYRRLGLSISEIKNILSPSKTSSPILRKKEKDLEIDKKRFILLKELENGADKNYISEKLEILEREESIYEKLERAFPGYFGQILFSAYKPFLLEPIEKDDLTYYESYIDFLNNLPPLDLSEEEKLYIEKNSSAFDLNSLDEINEEKIKSIYDYKNSLSQNKDIIDSYLKYKNSPEYLKSPGKTINDKLGKYMVDNNYYNIAIPLLRKFSKSYDDYYVKLLEANDYYLAQKKKD